jgi:hypothetical protein
MPKHKYTNPIQPLNIAETIRSLEQPRNRGWILSFFDGEEDFCMQVSKSMARSKTLKQIINA